MGLIDDFRDQVQRMRRENPTDVAQMAAMAMMLSIRKTLDAMTDDERIAFIETLAIGVEAAKRCFKSAAIDRGRSD